MPIFIPAFLMAVIATISYNAETCLGDGPDNVQEAYYCKQLASNDMDANDFIVFGSPIGAVFDGGL